MGLDAVVYRSRANLPFDADAVGAVLDASTGEYCCPDPALEPAFERRFPSHTGIAVRKRIGTISSVAELKQDTERVLNGESVILSKVLYSGTHGGDSIPMDLISKLEEELAVLRRYAEENRIDRVMQFVSDMKDLVAAARSEGNPIVF